MSEYLYMERKDVFLKQCYNIGNTCRSSCSLTILSACLTIQMYARQELCAGWLTPFKQSCLLQGEQTPQYERMIKAALANESMAFQGEGPKCNFWTPFSSRSHRKFRNFQIVC